MLLGLTGLARQVAIVGASMPAAVITTVLALEFDLDPSFATGAVFLSTLLSPFTLVCSPTSHAVRILKLRMIGPGGATPSARHLGSPSNQFAQLTIRSANRTP